MILLQDRSQEPISLPSIDGLTTWLRRANLARATDLILKQLRIRQLAPIGAGEHAYVVKGVSHDDGNREVV